MMPSISEVHQSLLQQNTPTTRCCHPMLHSWDGVLRIENLTIFPTYRALIIMAKKVQ
uniref:Uncharacterized protein n=1 Tax=Anguilla anguilla TaxID=7936 RepID=A0A0E9V4N8_ANGAN